MTRWTDLPPAELKPIASFLTLECIRDVDAEALRRVLLELSSPNGIIVEPAPANEPTPDA